MTDFPSILDNAINLDQQILSAASAVSPQYANLVSLAARQTIGSTELTISKGSDGSWNTSDVKAFMKDVGTSRWVICPAVSWLCIIHQTSQAGESCGDSLCLLSIFLVPESVVRKTAAITSSCVCRLPSMEPTLCGPGLRCEICLCFLTRAEPTTGSVYPNTTGSGIAHNQGVERRWTSGVSIYQHSSIGCRVGKYVDHDDRLLESLWGQIAYHHACESVCNSLQEQVLTSSSMTC